MFPNKEKMVRAASALLTILFVAPGVYILTAFLATFGKPGIRNDPTFILSLFIALAFVSAMNIGLVVYIQTSKRFMPLRAKYDPISRTYHVTMLSAILSEAISIYGLIITLLSASIIFAFGFSIVTWILLLWIRGRFRQSLGSLPDK